MKILLFLVYGTGRKYHLELTYSILSAARFLESDPAEVRLVLASDAPNKRPDLPVEHILIDDETLKSWQMDGSYKHAAKPNVLLHTIRHFGAPTVLIDSDTILHKHPKYLFERIDQGKSLMHQREGRLEQMQNWPEWKDLISRSNGNVAGRAINNDTIMLNSGVLGLDPQDTPLMNDVLAVMRDMRMHSDAFTVEQLAASLVFSESTTVSTCADIVEHYWDGPRPYYHYQMARMFPDVLSGGGIEKEDVNFQHLRREPPVRKFDRIATIIKRLQRGNDGAYAYAFLAYRSAFSCRHHDPDLANVWANIALSMLSFALPQERPETVYDFSGFGPEKLQTLSWMAPELQSRWQAYWLRFAS